VEERLRIAIAGTGFGEKYATGLKATPGVELAGVFSRRPERAADLAERFGIPFSTHRFGDLLEIPYLDAVAVVTPNSTHAELVRAAIQARKHVICDKPLALTAAEAVELYELAESARVKHITFVPYRFSPASVVMKKELEEQRVGRVVGVRASWGVDLREEPLRWRFQRKLSGPGVAADLGAHVLDLLTWWLGPVRRVLGRCQTVVATRPAEIGGRRRKVDVPDECWSLVEFARAGVGCVTLSWNVSSNQRVEIEGDRGRLVYESPSLLQWLDGRGPFEPSVTFTRADGLGGTTRLSLDGGESFGRQEDALAKMFGEIAGYLRTGERPQTVASFYEGAEVLRVIDALVDSSERGQWVKLDSTSC